jgi:hypothetical protein
MLDYVTQVILVAAVLLSWTSFSSIFEENGVPAGWGSVAPTVATGVTLSALSLMLIKYGTFRGFALILLSLALSLSFRTIIKGGKTIITSIILLYYYIALTKSNYLDLPR